MDFDLLDPVGLSHGLIADHDAYKRGTKVIVKWLVANGKCRRPATTGPVDLRQMLGLANNIKENNVTVPNDIAFTFRETIRLRAYISSDFVKNIHPGREDPVTNAHNHFTATLKNIYDVICPTFISQWKVKSNKPVSEQAYEKDYKPPSRSRFQPLLAEVDMTEADTDSEKLTHFTPTCRDGDGVASESTKPCSPSHTRATGRGEKSSIKDDKLSELMDIYSSMAALGALCLVVKMSWTRAAQGHCPIALAALMTTVVWKKYRACRWAIDGIPGVSNPADLLQYYSLLQQSTGLDLEVPLLKAGRSMLTTWKALEKWKPERKDVVGPSTKHEQFLQHLSQYFSGTMSAEYVAPLEKPSELVPAWDMNEGAEHKWLSKIFRSVEKLKDQSVPGEYYDLFYLCTPMQLCLKEYHDSSKGSPYQDHIGCTFGLDLLAESYRSFVWIDITIDGGIFYAPSSLATTENCRVRALTFAFEVKKTIAAVLKLASMSCQCNGTIGAALAHLVDSLEAYSTQRRFDLFHQAPWIAGAHMLHTYHNAFYIGIALCNHRNLVGSILHTYNILLKFSDLKNIPLLDKLCTIFRQSVFMGVAPNRNFQSCFLRFIGGRLNIKNRAENCDKGGSKGKGYSLVQGKEGPMKDGLRSEPNRDRFDASKFSLFHRLFSNDYHVEDQVWAQVLGVPCGANMTTKQETELNEALKYRTMKGHPMCKLEAAIMSEFEGDFPIGRVNFFAIYTACAEIFLRVNQKIHEYKSGDAIECLCLVVELMESADHYQENLHEPWREKWLLLEWKEAIEELREKPLEEFLWKNF